MTNATHDAHGNHGDAHANHAPHGGEAIRTYLIVYAALIVLLVLTIAAAFMHLGHLSIVVAMTIGCVKAALVVLYFMHVRLGSPLVKFFILAALLFLGMLASLTFSDYLTRSWLPNSEGWTPPVNLRRPG